MSGERKVSRRKLLYGAAAAAAAVALGAVAYHYARIPTLGPGEVVTETATHTGTRTTPLTETGATTLTETGTTTLTKTGATTFSYPESLRAAAEARGLLVGTCVEGVTHTAWEWTYPDPAKRIRIWENDPTYARVLTREFDLLTPGTTMNWNPIEGLGFIR